MSELQTNAVSITYEWSWINDNLPDMIELPLSVIYIVNLSLIFEQYGDNLQIRIWPDLSLEVRLRTDLEKSNPVQP